MVEVAEQVQDVLLCLLICHVQKGREKLHSINIIEISRKQSIKPVIQV